MSGVYNLRARIIRAIEAIEDGDYEFALLILCDLEVSVEAYERKQPAA